MDYLRSFALSAAGMTLERARVEVSAMNLANANTVLDPAGPGYRPLRVVAQPSFVGLMENADPSTGPSVAIHTDAVAPRLVYEPSHPFANAQGYVAYAGVDPATEMVTLMGAIRSYEANVAALNTARAMALRALEIGRSS